MSIDSLLMFSEIYGVSTDYILKGDETMTPSDALLEDLGAGENLIFPFRHASW